MRRLTLLERSSRGNSVKNGQQLRQFCAAAMTRMQFLATLLPCLRPFSNFSIAFSWRPGNVRQKNPYGYVKFYMHCHNLAAMQKNFIFCYRRGCS
ncbi:MAG: hypothetical protein DI595_22795 [Agrobacterium fabrum]|uniref:Uncharacterized protein n=1 Tax=Agrobacterium fabrum TaxID=1176649 RepID=A0A2W5EIP0_9HYPH|nr:MAG: hypothetical protein DI595_22795 [Agrobacterium fabrum]